MRSREYKGSAELKVLSFGAGVQSTALLLMSCKGILPKLDCCVFADTGYEPQAVYDGLEWCTKYAAKQGIPVHVVKGTVYGSQDGLRLDVLNNITKPDGGHVPALPFFTASKEGINTGISRRHCTANYKIYPINKFMREKLMGLKPRQHSPKHVVIEQWLGILSLIHISEPTRPY